MLEEICVSGVLYCKILNDKKALSADMLKMLTDRDGGN